jgi:hypothetical protein
MLSLKNGFLAGWMAMPCLAGALTVTHTSLADFRAGTGDGQVNFTSASGGEVVLQKAMSSLGSFSSTATLPLALHNLAAFMSDEAVYIVGGNNLGTLKSNVYSALVGAGGALGAWSALPSFPSPVASTKITSWSGRAYACGGSPTAQTVYMASILPGGGLGPWNSAGLLPQANEIGAFAAVNGFLVYLRVGHAGVNYTDVYSCPINGDGSLGAWTLQAGAARPHALVYGASVSTARGLFWFGGEDLAQLAVFGETYSSLVSDLGALSAWSVPAGGNLPVGRSYLLQNECDGYGRLFCVGGRAGMPTPYASATAYSAPLSGASGLGAWVAEASLPAARCANSVLVGKGRVWSLGGTDNALVSQNSVYSAAVATGAGNVVEGGYQNAFDLGADEPLISLSWTALPAANVAMQWRSAPAATGVFGPWSAVSTSSPLALAGSARWVEYKVLMTNPGAGSVELDDVNLSYGATPTASPSFSPSPTATATPTASPSASPSLTATPSRSPTATPSPTPTATPFTPTATPTPGLGLAAAILAPVPAKKGVPVCMYSPLPILESEWTVFAADQQVVARLSDSGGAPCLRGTAGMASGVYIVRIRYKDSGGEHTVIRNMVVK